MVTVRTRVRVMEDHLGSDFLQDLHQIRDAVAVFREFDPSRLRILKWCVYIVNIYIYTCMHAYIM